MPSLSDPATWRKPHYYRGFLYLHEPATIYTARVNQSSFPNPLAAVRYDDGSGALANVKVGMTILFGSSAGADDLGRSRVRIAPTSNTLFLGWSSLGFHDGEVNLADNAYITIIDLHQVWAKIPRITRDGTTFKDYNERPGNYNTHIIPVANAGQPRVIQIGSAESSHVFELDGSGSIAMHPGASIANYAWDIGDGTLESGYTSSDSVIEASFPAGFRYVYLTVTDSNGQSHTASVPVLVAKEGVTNTIRTFDFTRNVKRDGQTFTANIYEDIDTTTYPDGTLVLYWQNDYYDAVQNNLTGETLKFYGWLSESNERIGVNQSARSVDLVSQITCVDVAGRLQQLPGFPQVLSRRSEPSGWQEARFTSIDLYVHYLLQWHSNALSITDFERSNSNYPFPTLDSDGASLFDQANQRCEAIAYLLTCDTTGRLLMKADPNERDSNLRTSVVQVALEKSDYMLHTHQRNRTPRNHWHDAAALQSLAADADSANYIPLFAIAPGRAPGQGLSKSTRNYQLVASETELAARTGHQYAKMNNFNVGQTLQLKRGGDAGIEPALMEWLTADMTGVVPPRDNDLSTTRFLPTEVNYRSNPSGTIDVQVSIKFETVGLPATLYTPPSTGEPTYDDFASDLFPEIDPDPLYNQDPYFAVVRCQSPFVMRSFDITAEEPTWERIDDFGLSGELLDMGGTPQSSTFPMLFILESLGTGTIFFCANVMADSPVMTSDHTFSIVGSNFNKQIRIDDSVGASCVAWMARDGIRAIRYTGSAWGSTETVGTITGNDATADDRSLGMVVDGSAVLCCGKNGVADYGLYLAVGGSGSFVEVGGVNKPSLTTPINAIYPIDNGDCLVAIYDTSTTSGTIDIRNIVSSFKWNDYARNPNTFTKYSTVPTWSTGSLAVGAPHYWKWQDILAVTESRSLQYASTPSDTGILLGVENETFQGDDRFEFLIQLSDIGQEWIDINLYVELALRFDTSTTYNNMPSDTEFKFGYYVSAVAYDGHRETLEGQDSWVKSDSSLNLLMSRKIIDVGTSIDWSAHQWETIEVGIYVDDDAGWSYTGINFFSFSFSYDQDYVYLIPDTNKLYLVRNYASSPSWTDVTPPNGMVSATQYALHNDNNVKRGVMLGQNAGSPTPPQRLFISDDDGGNWVLENGLILVNNEVAYHLDDLYIIAGEQRFIMWLDDDDNDFTFKGYDRRGNSTEELGSFAQVKQVELVKT